MNDSRVKSVLSLQQLVKILQISRSTVYGRLDKKSCQYDSTFPRPIKLYSSVTSNGRIGFVEEEVMHWVFQKAQQRDEAV